MWLPLALSTLLMTGEILLVQAAVGRLPNEKLMLAALGVMFWTEVLIEAPIIMLLSTSTALTTTAQAYRVLRRFMIHINLAITVIAVVVAWLDPVFDMVLRGWMGIPIEIAEPTQTGMKIMSLWSAIVGWRRFNQGILIRFGQPRQVTFGTVVRLCTSASVAGGLTWWGGLSGIEVAATTFLSSVTTEALYAWWKTRAIVAQHLRTDDQPPVDPLTYRAVLAFHMPLAATSVLSFIALPLLNAGLARMAQPQLSLAAWPLLYSVILLFRGPGIALPETVIAMLRAGESQQPLRRFCWMVAAGSTAALAIVALTPLLPLYLQYVLAVGSELGDLVRQGVLIGLLIPALAALSSMYRGFLMTDRRTPQIYWGMTIYLVVTVVGMVAGVNLQSRGILTASLAISVATLLEAAWLAQASRRARRVGQERVEDI